jgi:hypothetical protein
MVILILEPFLFAGGIFDMLINKVVEHYGNH